MRLALSLAAATAAVLVATASASPAPALTKHDRDVIRFFQHHPALARTPGGAAALSKLLPRVVRSLQDSDARRAAQSAYPPHHALWVCIARHESGGNPRATNGRYRGYLQLHLGWGHGTSYDASADSQAVQEWGAERAWAESGYSYSFLYGQWYEWDNADGCGTTG